MLIRARELKAQKEAEDKLAEEKEDEEDDEDGRYFNPFANYEFQQLEKLQFALDGRVKMTEMEARVLAARIESQVAQLESLVPTTVWQRMNKKSTMIDLLKVCVLCFLH